MRRALQKVKIKKLIIWNSITKMGVAKLKSKPNVNNKSQMKRVNNNE